MALCLQYRAVAYIDQHEREIGRRRARDHVARVLHVARSVGNDELAARRGEVTVGHVDGDALFALGAQAVGEQCEVDVIGAHLGRGPFDRLELILEDRFRVVEKAADERRLAVVYGARCGEAQQLHQK